MDDIQVKRFLGVLPFNSLNSTVRVPIVTVRTTKQIPASFDSRTAWPSCIHSVMDQGSCGSCWAFAASEGLLKFQLTL